MLLAGKSIIQADVPLQSIDLNYFIKSIKSPRQEIRDLIKQLRTLRSLDKQKYNQLKKRLPYITCGIFKPPYRRTVNFAYIRFFIIDIDNLFEKGFNINELKNKIFADPCVHAVFESPGADGLKLVFKLKQNCHDAAKYSVFYKSFVNRFSKKHSLEQVIDRSTSDVCRACFISYDENLLFRDNPEEVDINDFVDFENLQEVNKILKEVKKDEKKEIKQIKQDEIADDVLEKIKMRLNPRIKYKIEKKIFVPEKLNEIVNDVEKEITKFGIKITGITSINYGKKFNFEINNKLGEINLFYGKKGFTVVKSPKQGTSEELNDICHKIICSFLFGTEE